MFRLFRRKKKEAPDEKVEEKKVETVSSEIEPSDITLEETKETSEPIFEIKESPFEDNSGTLLLTSSAFSTISMSRWSCCTLNMRRG